MIPSKEQIYQRQVLSNDPGSSMLLKTNGPRDHPESPLDAFRTFPMAPQAFTQGPRSLRTPRGVQVPPTPPRPFKIPPEKEFKTGVGGGEREDGNGNESGVGIGRDIGQSIGTGCGWEWMGDGRG